MTARMPSPSSTRAQISSACCVPLVRTIWSGDLEMPRADRSRVGDLAAKLEIAGWIAVRKRTVPKRPQQRVV